MFIAKLVIVGSTGLVGSELRRLANARDLPVAQLTHADCDIGMEGDVRRALASTDGQTVINCAAYNSVDRAESEPDLARRVNAEGAGNIARAAHVVAHYSTDFVFDGSKSEPYVEEDRPNPQSAYARSKSDGDEEVRRANPRHYLLRVGCLYGRTGRGFGSTLLTRLKAGERIRSDGERRIQPTWARCVAEQTLALLPTERYGLYHAMCHGETTWAEFARELARQAGYAPGLVDAVSTASLGAPARRPRYAVLENRALAILGLDLMPDWRGALSSFLETELTREGVDP